MLMLSSAFSAPPLANGASPSRSIDRVLALVFSPETSPQLIDSSSQHRSVAFQAAMPPFLGVFFRVSHPIPPRTPSVALNSALISPSLRLCVEDDTLVSSGSTHLGGGNFGAMSLIEQG